MMYSGLLVATSSPAYRPLASWPIVERPVIPPSSVANSWPARLERIFSKQPKHLTAEDLDNLWDQAVFDFDDEGYLDDANQAFLEAAKET